MKKGELLRRLPKVDEVLNDQRLFAFLGNTPRETVLEAVREEIEERRQAILNMNCEGNNINFQGENMNCQGKERNCESIISETPHDGKPQDSLNYDEIIEGIIERLREKKKRSLRRTINATGVTLHTNLGRARISRGACRAVAEVAENYSTLEYDVKKGMRGSRHDHVEKIITKITGAEAAMVVNNNAAATMICLASMAKDKEVIVSRGELVEIGGSFRVPEIMEQSGAVLREVGTTNKTKEEDYINAINENTGALLKVHTSNYKIIGFTAEVSVHELSVLGRSKNLPLIYDMGSGLMVDLSKYGINEPTVMEGIRAGADVVLFSGDKLLGGPQAGIIIGNKKYINAMKKHPLARVLRVDKVTLAALEATFSAYLDEEKVMKELPVLSMLSACREELSERAERMKNRILSSVNNFSAEVIATQDLVGGGSAPTAVLNGFGVTVSSEYMNSEGIEKELRGYETPIIVRIVRDKILINMRTITEEEENIIVCALEEIDKKMRVD